jgi:hypothetical protein
MSRDREGSRSPHQSRDVAPGRVRDPIPLPTPGHVAQTQAEGQDVARPTDRTPVPPLAPGGGVKKRVPCSAWWYFNVGGSG